MSGVEVAREVREMGCPLYIVGCTGNALREDQVSRFLRFSSRSMLMGHAGRVHRSRSGRHHPQTRPPESRGRVHTRSETASRRRDGTEGSRAGVRGWITYDGDALNTVLKFSHIWVLEHHGCIYYLHPHFRVRLWPFGGLYFHLDLRDIQALCSGSGSARYVSTATPMHPHTESCSVESRVNWGKFRKDFEIGVLPHAPPTIVITNSSLGSSSIPPP